MKAELTPLKEKSLDTLKNVDLRHLLLDASAGTALLQFTFSPSEPDTTIELSRISLFKVSIDSDVGGELAFVGQVEAFQFEDAGQEVLSKLEYCLQKEPGVVRTPPEQVSFYFHIEGDMCADIVCGAYSVRRVPFGSAANLAACISQKGRHNGKS